MLTQVSTSDKRLHFWRKLRIWRLIRYSRRMPTTTASLTVLPPDDLDELKPLTDALPKMTPRLRLGLTAFVETLRRGEAVRVEPMATVLTTSQAAEILNISRMTLVKLLDDGRIAYQQPNVHRQIRLVDVLAYKEERSRQRTAYLEDSMQQAEEDDLLMLDIKDYAASLREVRSRQL